MNYEKPEIKFQKFHTEAFLEDEPLSSGEGDEGHDIFQDSIISFNGSITTDSSGVGGWFNG